MNRTHPSIPAILVCVAVLVLAAAAVQADTKGRTRVTDFSFEFEPATGMSEGLDPLTVCIVPMINSNQLSRHTRNIDKALRNIEPAEAPRVLGIRYDGRGKPVIRFLAGETFEDSLTEALSLELAALGMELMPPPIDEPPADLRDKTLLGLVDMLPAGDVPDILLAVEIEDFFFETRPGAWNIRMETFFNLDLKVVDVASQEILWEGGVETGELEKKGAYMGKLGVEKRLNLAFQDLIEGVLRNNMELRKALTEVGRG